MITLNVSPIKGSAGEPSVCLTDWEAGNRKTGTAFNLGRKRKSDAIPLTGKGGEDEEPVIMSVKAFFFFLPANGWPDERNTFTGRRNFPVILLLCSSSSSRSCSRTAGNRYPDPISERMRGRRELRRHCCHNSRYTAGTRDAYQEEHHDERHTQRA